MSYFFMYIERTYFAVITGSIGVEFDDSFQIDRRRGPREGGYDPGTRS